jgi:KUP system potassium uptake protein
VPLAAQKKNAPLAPLALAALGVVFGDIGTSPLYALKSCFGLVGADPARPADVFGIASLLIWALVIVVCLKYVTFIMRIDHDGEGGILALLARATPPSLGGAPVHFGFVTVVVIVGAAMLLGDGAITPAISVISAVEGLDVATPAAHPFLVPIAIGILVALFALQPRGTGKVGVIFGPAMIAWFLMIGVAGGLAIASHPQILEALDPRYAAEFMIRHRPGGFFVLGGVVLAVTGVEALYADLSHFGRRPIVLAWYGVVFPALVICYVGESARVLEQPALIANPFYALTPGWTLYPSIALATLATIIASQALISGAFTLAEQAIALGLWPRMRVRHTSADVRGQVFVPAVNTTLAIVCILLVIYFKSSDRLAAAYGLAVPCTMLATSIAYYVVIERVLHWPAWRAVPLLVAFVIVDGSFVIAGLPKFVDGGWVPFVIAATLSFASIVWRRGRRRVVAAIAEQSTPLDTIACEFGAPLKPDAPAMVLLTPDPDRVPFMATHRWIRDRAHEEHVVLLKLAGGPNPTVSESNRVRVDRLAPSLTRIVATFGYMELPRLAPIITAARALGLDLDRDDTSYFYADPKIEDPNGGDGSFAQRVFVWMQRSERPLPDDLGIPANRRIELSVSVDYNADLHKNGVERATAPAETLTVP